MNIKEFLNIEDNHFTLSNEHLFIHHGNGEEFVMTIHNKKKYTNPNIPHQKNSLAHHFQIPITPEYNNTLIYKDLIVYQEIYEKYTTSDGRYIGDSQQPRFAAVVTHRLNIVLHPNPKPKKEPTDTQHERMNDLLARWEPILNPPHKIKLTENLTHSLETTGHITDLSDLIMANYLPITYQPTARLIPSEQVPVMEPPPPLRYLYQPPEHITFTADTWQDQLNPHII